MLMIVVIVMLVQCCVGDCAGIVCLLYNSVFVVS